MASASAHASPPSHRCPFLMSIPPCSPPNVLRFFPLPRLRGRVGQGARPQALSLPMGPLPRLRLNYAHISKKMSQNNDLRAPVLQGSPVRETRENRAFLATLRKMCASTSRLRGRGHILTCRGTRHGCGRRRARSRCRPAGRRGRLRGRSRGRRTAAPRPRAAPPIKS
jgi:hypothetical protein